MCIYVGRILYKLTIKAREKIEKREKTKNYRYRKCIGKKGNSFWNWFKNSKDKKKGSSKLQLVCMDSTTK